MSDVHLSVVVLSWNTREILRACLASLARDVPCEPREIIVVDNASADGSAEMVARDFPEVRLIRNDENRLYAEANNQGARAAGGRFLCLLNSDTEVRPGALDRLTGFLESHPDYAAVAPKLVNVDGAVQRACRRFPNLLEPLLESTSLGNYPPGSWLFWWSRMRGFDHEHSRDVEQPPGACLVMKREEFLAMGGLDPALSLFFNDVDLCRALLHRGRRIRYLAEAEVMHHQGASTRAQDASRRNLLWTQNRAAYYRKNHGRMAERWLRVVLWLWALEYRFRIRFGSRAADAKQAALAELDGFLRKCARA
jgi:N-acetylglucosaminyl-diphospho-decaprenol L-rhamnosyltransferase